MFRYILSLFWKEKQPDLSLEDVYNVLASSQESPEEDLEPKDTLDDNHGCLEKSGIITAFNDGVYSIDNTYTFKSDLKTFDVGVKVSYMVFSYGGKVHVTNVTVADDWESNLSPGRSSWCVRKVICQVIQRNGRELVTTEADLSIDLNNVSTEFIPIVGDWLEIEVKVTLDENVSDLAGKVLEVNKIYPLRVQVLQGQVKRWCEKSRTGLINKSIFFMEDALASGYIPVVGDKVTTEVIESSQGNCTWRALKVVSDNQTKTASALISAPFVKFESNVENVIVSGNVYITCDQLGEQEKFSITVKNKCCNNLKLYNVSLPTKNIYCKALQPTVLENITIETDESVEFEFICTVKCVGTTRELILFTFETFKIGRWIVIELKSTFNNSVTRYEKKRNSQTSFNLGNSELIRGQKLVSSARFVAVRLPDYSLPKKLELLVSQYEEKDDKKLLDQLGATKPCLTLPFAFNIYEDRFHTLLHLEEIEQNIAANNYKQDQVCFIKNGEFLMLEIENLAEKRPSLIVGDKIITKYSKKSEPSEFEGIIHKIAFKHVYIKFAKMFHAQYNGDEMDVMVVMSRSSFRRTHQAIGLVMKNLGVDFLFPTQIVIRKPQINFTYEKYNKPLQLENTKASNQILSLKASPQPKLSRNRQIINSLNAIKNRNNERNKLNVSSPVNTEQPNGENDSNTDATSNYHESKTVSHTQPLLQKLEWFNKDLNYYQKEAIRNILLGETRPLPYIIFGPPGTGKTVTVVEIILQILRFIPHSRLLVATPSNSAANVLALKLLDSEILIPGDLVRLVAYRVVVENSVPARLVPYCATVDLAREGTRTTHCDPITENGIKLGMNCSALGRHRITVGTCGGLGALFNMGFPKGHFTHVIIDEAGQLTEPESMIPLAFLEKFSGQAILAGDPLQLGPIIMSPCAKKYGLGETFMDRLLNRFPYLRDINGFPETDGYDPRFVTKLVFNYRSLPNALVLFNNMFYEGQLLPTVSPSNSPEAHLLSTLTEMLPYSKSECNPSIVFHGVNGLDTQAFDSPSWYNPDEAAQVFFYVNELYRLGVKSSSICIISPYVKQGRIMRNLFVQAEFEIPKIGTVEEVQGQEYNIVILSTVRSSNCLVNDDIKSKLGFIFAPKRINVAISRAKVLNIILGNPNVLSQDVHWRRVIQYCIENESYVGCDFQISDSTESNNF